MRNRRTLVALAVAIAVTAASGFVMTSVGGAASHKKAGTVLCSASGTKMLDKAGVVNVAVRGANAGTPVKCAGKLTGRWVKNSKDFSWQTLGSTTLGADGTFKALSGPIMGPNGKVAGTLTGSGLSGGADITVDAGCEISYPPLKIRCWIIISAA